jgi:hypothetical protein
MKVKLWHIVQGPFHRDDLPDADDVPDGLEYMMVIKTEAKHTVVGQKKKKKEVYDAEYWFPDFNSVQAIVTHFSKSIEPLKMEV